MVAVENFSSSRGGRALIFAPADGDGQSSSTSRSSFVSKDSENQRSNSLMQTHASTPAVFVADLRSTSPILEFPEESTVRQVLKEIEQNGRVTYKVEFEDGHIETMLEQRLVKLDNGKAALSSFQNSPAAIQGAIDSEEGTGEDIIKVSTRNTDDENDPPLLHHTRRNKPPVYLFDEDDGEDEFTSPPAVKKRKVVFHETSLDDSSDELANFKTRSKLFERRIPTARRKRNFATYSKETESSSGFSDRSNNVGRGRSRAQHRVRTSSSRIQVRSTRLSKHRHSARQSQRSTRHVQNMAEPSVDDIFRSDSEIEERNPKFTGAKEFFQTLPAGNPFRLRHVQQCETCRKDGGGALGQLIHCQGCTLSYHRTCIGHRASRDHLVTKIDNHDFVLQCRCCVRTAQRRDAKYPNQGMCQDCRQSGQSCLPFRERQSSAQEERAREQNGGEDPIATVDPQLVNNADNVLFRCLGCSRAFHFHHLRPKSDVIETGDDEQGIARRRFTEYSRDWQCLDCSKVEGKVGALVAWRPANIELYTPGASAADMNEDDKEYLIKWVNKSYFQCQWMSGAWIWGVVAAAMVIAFTKRNEGLNLPSLTTEDAIPEEYLRIDIVLDVEFTSKVDTQSEVVDKARIHEVASAYCKYKGLGYEDAVWEKPPTPDDGDRWVDFVTAYEDWVMGRHIRYPKLFALKARIEKVKATDFNSLEKKKQPSSLNGGELMKYQLDGLNWLYYRWYLGQNGILADEMGLGKTIQIIGMLATLVQDHQCFPFLVVVPNSICANWRREIKKWASNLRVVAYFGSAEARRLAYRYELYPNGSTHIRCHIVVTSYDAAVDDSSFKFLKSVSWQGLIVDEGQRLKSDKSQLYSALSKLNIPFRTLLTGTPLQNNARELFNLLQFLSKNFNAEELELKYAELTKQNVPELHDLIRPFFLRRTKVQVLTFLPPMAQIIIPVSMSTVQTKLYKSILAKRPELIQAIFNPSRRSIAKADRSPLNNLLLQLRKCLNHPFVYSKEIEERNVTAAVSHRNLVEASAKLQLLELLLPKLKERGHRVLLFSQFLDMLDVVEDFLDGLQLQYQRLDGSISSLTKQKRIDEFNQPDSPLFAFLLSTRAGGVGINLATADTVIIIDPDFNPHQDIQALSRAHRIGQKKKVLCIQLMTRSSVEEKIMQSGRKKMALDHVLIENLDSKVDEIIDVESILRYGAAEILEGKTQELRYDSASIEKLLDRSQIEDTRSGEDNSAESQFSFARVWANDTASLMDSLGSEEEAERPPNQDAWEKILQEREQLAAAEAAARSQTFGRGKRARQTVNYQNDDVLEFNKAPANDAAGNSDTDFQAQQDYVAPSSSSEDSDGDGDHDSSKRVDPDELRNISPATQRSAFQRARVVWPLPNQAIQATQSGAQEEVSKCLACSTLHRQGFCPLKLAGVEYCNLCGLAHFGIQRSCPHIRSETQIAEILQALKQSPEPQHLIEIATKYLKGARGSIIQERRKKETRKFRAFNPGVTSKSQMTGPSAKPSTTPSTNKSGNSAAPVATVVATQPAILEPQGAHALSQNPAPQPPQTAAQVALMETALNTFQYPNEPPRLPNRPAPRPYPAPFRTSSFTTTHGVGSGSVSSGTSMDPSNSTFTYSRPSGAPSTPAIQAAPASQSHGSDSQRFRATIPVNGGHYKPNVLTIPPIAGGPPFATNGWPQDPYHPPANVSSNERIG